MIKVDKKTKRIMLDGDHDDIIEEIYNACVGLCRVAIEQSDSMYMEVFGKIDEIPDKVARLIESEYDIDWETLEDEQREKDRPFAESEIEKIRSSDRPDCEKKAMERLIRAIFDLGKESDEKEKEKK